jgi:hypothetical protein
MYNSHVWQHHPDVINDNSLGSKDLKAVIDGLTKVAKRVGKDVVIPKLSDASFKAPMSFVASMDPPLPTPVHSPNM